jgi:hypothetical protein
VVLFCILVPQQRDVGIVRVEDIALGGALSLVMGSMLPLLLRTCGLQAALGAAFTSADSGNSFRLQATLPNDL